MILAQFAEVTLAEVTLAEVTLAEVTLLLRDADSGQIDHTYGCAEPTHTHTHPDGPHHPCSSSRSKRSSLAQPKNIQKELVGA